MLAGKIVDADGEPLGATHACKGKVRHRYYVSRALQRGISDTGLRVPAREIEGVVVARLATLLTDPLDVVTAASLELSVDRIEALHRRCQEVDALLRQRRSPELAAIVQQVQVGAAAITLTLDAAALAGALGQTLVADAPATVTLSSPGRLTRSGSALRLVQDNGTAPLATPDKALVRLLVQARGWWAVLRAGETSATELAQREGVTASYLTRVVRLAFLSPAVTGAILAGRQRAGVTVAKLTLDEPVPADWRAQGAALLPTTIG